VSFNRFFSLKAFSKKFSRLFKMIEKSTVFPTYKLKNFLIRSEIFYIRNSSSSGACFVCNLPILSHQVGLVWQGGNGVDDLLRNQMEMVSEN